MSWLIATVKPVFSEKKKFTVLAINYLQNNVSCYKHIWSGIKPVCLEFFLLRLILELPSYITYRRLISVKRKYFVKPIPDIGC